MQINVVCLENMFATNGSEPFMQINQIIDLILQDEGTLDEMASNHFVWPRTILYVSDGLKPYLGIFNSS